MQTSIEDFKTGWYSITLGVKRSELDKFICALAHLRDENASHFHARSTFAGIGGIGDIEFYLLPEGQRDDMTFDYSEAIYPKDQ